MLVELFSSCACLERLLKLPRKANWLKSLYCHAGINTAIYSPSGANSGVGFAIPVDIVRSSVDQIIKFGRVIRPILGISFAPDQSSEQVCMAVLVHMM